MALTQGTEVRSAPICAHLHQIAYKDALPDIVASTNARLFTQRRFRRSHRVACSRILNAYAPPRWLILFRPAGLTVGECRPSRGRRRALAAPTAFSPKAHRNARAIGTPSVPQPRSRMHGFHVAAKAPATDRVYRQPTSHADREARHKARRDHHRSNRRTRTWRPTRRARLGGAFVRGASLATREHRHAPALPGAGGAERSAVAAPPPSPPAPRALR